jgi:hypothetical protein
LGLLLVRRSANKKTVKELAVFSQLSGSKTGGFCELMPILKGFSLTWRSLANGMLGDAKINQDKTPAG